MYCIKNSVLVLLPKISFCMTVHVNAMLLSQCTGIVPLYLQCIQTYRDVCIHHLLCSEVRICKCTGLDFRNLFESFWHHDLHVHKHTLGFFLYQPPPPFN